MNKRRNILEACNCQKRKKKQKETTCIHEQCPFKRDRKKDIKPVCFAVMGLSQKICHSKEESRQQTFYIEIWKYKSK